MFYLIGLGLNEKGISLEGLEIIKKCERVYLENYTVEFPYETKDLEKQFKKKIISVNREFVESFEVLDEAKKKNICLLIYGSPLTATTHISLIQEAKKRKIKFKVIYSASVLGAIAESGLQLYKFGKITSIPNFEAESFIEVIKENLSINAHSLILADIGLDFKDALRKLEQGCNKNNVKLDKIIICSRLGMKDSKIFYDKIQNLMNKNIKNPYCFITPGKLHFVESEMLELFH